MFICFTTGVLVHRLLGQKRLEDENSASNSITANQLFSLYPQLKEYMITVVQQGLTQNDIKEHLVSFTCS